MSASQLSSDDLRNVEQALIIQNSFNSLSAIKYLRLNLGLECFLPDASSKLKKEKEERHAQ